MPPIPATVRRALAAAARAASTILISASVFAAAPSVTPKVLQCDGSFTTGSITSHPAPTVRADLQSSSPGLKIGRRRLSVLPASTVALWRFDGNYAVTVSSCYVNGCDAGTTDCRTALWKTVDTNGSTPLQLGRCAYDCAGARNVEPVDQNPVQVGACPATLPAASTFAVTAVGPLPGEASLGLSSTALQLNGVNMYATAPNASAWDLPATYTLAAWVNATGNGRIVSQQGNGYWGIGVSAGGLRHFDSRDASVGADLTRGGGLIGGWHLVHLVRTNGVERRFYIDGVLVGSAVAASSSAFASHPNNAPLVIGSHAGTGEFLAGELDDVRVLDNAISAADIMLEWTTQMHRYSSDTGVSFSSVAGSFDGSPANGTLGAVTYIPPEAYSAAARWEFAAQNIDGESAFSGSYGVTLDNSPPIAPTLTAVATSANDVTWSWGAPPRVCLPPGSASVFYQLVDAPTGTSLIPPGNMAYPAASVGENIAGSGNQLVGRKLRLTDTWGSSLSPATSIYTLANAPLADSVAPSVISTGSALINWNQNGNPSYTRYLVSYSQDALFGVGVSTPAALADGHTGSSIALANLAPGTTYYVRVQAFSGRSSDVFGGAATVFVSTSFTTLPGAPALSGLPLSNESVQWSWTAVPGAQYYNLFDVSGSTLYTGSALAFAQGGLQPNTQFTAFIEAVSSAGGGARGTAATFTLANDPTVPVVSAAHVSSITYSWNANLNPGYTFYEVAITTDSSFSIVVTTVTVAGTTATATGLFPGTTYFARVRSINGSQQLGNYVAFASARTLANGAITVVLAPPSSYVPASGSVGQWHFDEGAGTSAADTSGLGNAAVLACLAAACVSTPTYVAGPAGLGTAVSFTGVDNGLVRVPDTGSYGFIDDLTVSAWVKPSSLSQPNGAGIVVRGDGGAENFALDVSGALYRFVPKPGFVAASTNSITAGAWTHLVGVYDSAAGSATLYVNGRPASTVLLVPARTAAAHDISIGNRQSAAGAYDRGFLGGIDAVRVQRRAMSAAEALAEYQGAFVSTVTPPAPNDAVLIGLAPNAFGAPATLFVSVDPFTHPITITPAILNAGLTVIPTGFTLVPNSFVEIVPIVGGTPFTQTLGSSASISIPYADANGDNIIDNTSPPLAASAITIYTLNTTVNRWEALPTYVDPASRRATVFTPHFSVFAMFAPLTIGTSLSQVRVYPIPWKPGTGGRFDAPSITFDRLPASGTIRIINLAGERVREFAFDGSSVGAAAWNGVTDSGRRAASGVYFARITGDAGSNSLVKFAIER